MKRLIIYVISVSLGLFAVASAWASEWQTSSQAFAIANQTAQSMNIRFALPDYKMTQASVNGTTYHKILSADAGYFQNRGAPELPFFSTMIAIPNHGQVSVEIVNTHQQTLDHILPYPAQNAAYAGNPRGFEVTSAIYQSGEVFPREVIQYSDPQILRDFRVITIQVQPFCWDSATHQLTVRDQIEFRLCYSDQPGVNELNEPFQISPAFDKVYQSLILNYAEYRTEASMMANTPARIVIIHGNYTDAVFQQKLANYALWKRQKGSDVRLVSTAVTGTTNNAIKTYLQNIYNDVSSRPDYVIIIGDTQGSFLVPTWSNNGSGDYPYQMLAGGDQLGDCFLGRISAENTSQLDVIFSKIYAYEKNLNVANANWLNRMLIVGDTAHSGISVTYIGRYIQELALAHNPDYTFTMLLQNGPSPSAMNAAINEGVGFFNYRGYAAMSGWNPSENLINGNKLCHAVIITCGTGSFNGSVATSESFIRLGTSATPKGAVTAIGMDTLETHTMPNNCLTGAIFDGIYIRGMRTMGEALLNGKLYMAAIYQNTQPGMVASFTHWCNLMGDPTMEVYTKIPDTFVTNSPLTVALGTPNLDITITDQDGEAVRDACVTLTQGGFVIARAYSNQAGLVYLTINDGLVSGAAIITVSKHDYKPLQQTITVDSEGSLVAGASLYDDNAAGNSIGNGNYAPNSGETLEVLFSVKNTTGVMISGVSGFVTSDDLYTTVLDSLLSFGNINAGATVYCFSPALVYVSPTCQDYSHARLSLHLYDSNNQAYIVQDDILVFDASLNYTSHVVSDANNQALDPGETVFLTLTIANSGSLGITNVSGKLYTLNHLVSVEDDTASFGNVSIGGQATCTTDNFTIMGRAQILPGMSIPMRIKLTNPAGFLKWIDFTLNVGAVSVTSPFGPDNYGYVIYDDGDTFYSSCPVYQWVGIAPSEGGSGTALAISDPGTGTEGDAVSAVSLANVSLPFTFQFYGVDYTQITVCSNGFVAMGITQDASFRNYHIPGAMGPAAMIAPFWDDLSTGTGSGIYTWFDAASHRFIIEWHQMKNGYQPSMNETFQVILYDPAYYPTSLGDGPIKIQYQTFNNVDSGTGNQEHGVYSTIGIQDQMHQNGLEYSFNNTYPPAARHLANGRCIYITNAPVYDIVPELSVEAIGVTDTNGNSVPEPGETIQLQIQLLNSGAADTELAVTTLSTFDPYVVVGTSESEFPTIPVGGAVFNQLPFTLSISPNCPGNHVVHLCLDIIAGPYLEQLNFSIIAEKPELSLESYYLNDLAANNNGIADPNEDFLLILNVTNLSPSDAVNINATLSSTQPEVTIGNPVQTKPRLHLDDKVQFVFPIHFGALAVGTSVPFNFAYMAENSVTGNIAINVICGSGAANGSGVIRGTVTLSNAADPSPVLLTTAHHFFTYPATDGSYAFYFPIGSYSIAAALQYYFHEPIEPVMITDTNPDQQIDIAMAFLANPTCLTIVGEADESEAILTWVAPENPDYPVQIYRVYRKLNSGVYTVVAEPEGTTCVDALTEQGTYSYYVSAIYSQGEGAASEVQTLDFPFVSNPDEPGFIAVTTLQQNFPNPFNPTTTIAFSLAKPGTVNLKIYNTKGQLIKMLVSDFKAAGMHRITWNSVDSSGKPVSSGIYLYRLEAHNFSATRKMILIK